MASLSKNSSGGLGNDKKNGLTKGTRANGPSSFLERPHNLASPLPPDERGHGWENLSLLSVGFNASKWFEGIGTVTASENIAARGRLLENDVLRDLFPLLFGEAPDEFAIRDLVKNPEQLGEQMPIPESDLGQKLLRTLEDLGTGWQYVTQVPLTVNEENASETTYVEIPELQLVGLGQWGNGFGTPYSQEFSILRDVNGEERCLWSSSVLVATRPYTHLMKRDVGQVDDEVFFVETSADAYGQGALSQGEVCEFAHLPCVATRAFFLAETPFPSTQLMTMPRSMAFPDVPEELYPRPIVIIERDKWTQGFATATSDAHRYAGGFFPSVVRMGWLIPNVDEDILAKILPVVSNGLGFISTMFEDGFRNFNNVDYPYPFDLALDSAATFRHGYEPDGDSFGFSRWVPVSLIGPEIIETSELATVAGSTSQAGNESGRAAYERVVQEGVGNVIANSTNNFAWNWLIPNRDWDPARHYLDIAARMFEEPQSVNAKSNLGIVEYLSGNVDEAITLFSSVIEGPIRTSDAEASYFLSLIYNERGDTKAANRYRELCVESGGYECTLDLDTLRSESNDFSASKTAPASNFGYCSQCGKPRSQNDKFCSNCGENLS